jgi:hypothetical protein
LPTTSGGGSNEIRWLIQNAMRKDAPVRVIALI